MSKQTQSIVALDRFILSTRDSGYKSTTSAVSELVDNAIQAGARSVAITIEQDSKAEFEDADLRISVADDGSGMTRAELVQALRFGGSSRYNNREGMGRFGMGLPNASLGQARRVTVFTWQEGAVLRSYLDVDEIAAGKVVDVPVPKSVTLAAVPAPVLDKTHGTAVVWQRCDRVDNSRVSTVARKLAIGLGRTFRHFLAAGMAITINEELLKPRDPLFLMPNAVHSGARQFQQTWTCEVYANPENLDEISAGTVSVIFTELPIDAWHSLSNDRKRELGVATGAGVSIVRAGREVDYGWFFMGNKRRENYDDWWRCEVRFDPVLDEAFGITHTKQQVRPKEHLLEALSPFMESTAKVLNGRARQAYLAVKTSATTAGAEEVASSRHDRMRPLPASAEGNSVEVERLVARHPVLRSIKARDSNAVPSYHLIEDEFADNSFFRPVRYGSAVVGVLNPQHSFYKAVYAPLVAGIEASAVDVVNALQLVFIAAARAELSIADPKQKAAVQKFREEWSHAMNVLLAKR